MVDAADSKSAPSNRVMVRVHSSAFMLDIHEIEQNELDSEKMNLARSIFISYFTDLYKNTPPETLGIADVPLYLNGIFDKTEIALKKLEIRGYLAYMNNEPAGFSTCGLLEDSTILLLRTIPVHLQYKGREMEIRNAFLSYFLQQFPTAQSIVMMVRKANSAHASLCLQGGFKKDSGIFNQSNYLKTTYSTDWYDPYVLL